ncbi:hypothetical protein ACHAW5_010205 [Stephanodiscus triporus]|uniref:Glycoside hydrolase family 5 domain-containing protein n=1 Tax=Stephanodiscus triporus TaxID=2934178 RepID=A0ABD3NDZ5_9STRA
MAAYQSISVDLRRDGEDESDPEGPVADSRNHDRANSGNGFILPKGLPKGLRRRLLSPACLALGAVLALVALGWGRRGSSSPSPSPEPSSPSSIDDGDVATDLPPLPAGVNLASWFSLEDWFFVGDDGAVEVASPDDSKAASCLPPLHLDSSTGPRWNSETDLLAGLAGHYAKDIAEEGAKANSTTGGSLGGWGKAVRAIHAFRSSYYDIDDELRTMSKLGIKYVRVPVSWCWTDHDPTWLVTQSDNGDVNYITDDDVKEKFACEDPFYDGVYWPAIPRVYFRRFLRACAQHGIGATIDLHTYPGGTSIGTFSGVWPRYSRFWTHGDVPSTDDGRRPDVGRTLLRDFIGWMESLETSDPQAFEGQVHLFDVVVR